MLAGLVVAGMLAALLSLAQAALFSLSSALSRDAWYAVTARRGREGRRIFAARLVVVAAAAAGAAAAARWPLDASETLLWALAMSAAGTLIPVVAGLYWKRCTAIAAVAGMVIGSGVVCLMLAVTLGLSPAWLAPRAAGLGPAPAALLGALASLVVTVGASLARLARAEARDELYSTARRDSGTAQTMPEAGQ